MVKNRCKMQRPPSWFVNNKMDSRVFATYSGVKRRGKIRFIPWNFGNRPLCSPTTDEIFYSSRNARPFLFTIRLDLLKKQFWRLVLNFRIKTGIWAFLILSVGTTTAFIRSQYFFPIIAMAFNQSFLANSGSLLSALFWMGIF